MRTHLRTLSRGFVFAGLLTGGFAFGQNDALLQILVNNGTITQAQANDVRAQMARESGPPAPERVVVTPNRGTISELRIRGRIQGQYAYSDGSNSGIAAGAGDYSTFEVRRVRLGVQGRIYDDWRFLVEANVLTNTDLDSATLTYTAIPEANITFGKAKPQFGHEENTSSASILTMERSRLTGIFNGGKPTGLRVHGRSGIFSYYTGVYNASSVATDRMPSNIDSFLFNVSGGLNLDEMVGDGLSLRLRLDYLNNQKDRGFYPFKDAVAFSTHFMAGEFDMRAEYMYGKRFDDNKIRGFYLMPSFYIIPKELQVVGRYESIRGDEGVSLGANRYADRVPGLYRAGNRYNAFYLGLNYYIHGDNLKLMGGVERAESKDSSDASDAKGRSTTFITGVRMQF
jgi:phosphate-selective porin OprO/OprP